MKKTVKDYLIQQRIMLDKLAKKLGMNYLPVSNKNKICGYLLGKNKIIPVEAKIREFSSNKFESTLFELKKVNDLSGFLKRNQFTTFYYVEFFNDKSCIVFDLPSLPFEWGTLECNSVTTDSSKKKLKQVAMVSYNHGTNIFLDNEPQEFTLRNEIYTSNGSTTKVKLAHRLF